MLVGLACTSKNNSKRNFVVEATGATATVDRRPGGHAKQQPLTSSSSTTAEGGGGIFDGGNSGEGLVSFHYATRRKR